MPGAPKNFADTFTALVESKQSVQEFPTAGGKSTQRYDSGAMARTVLEVLRVRFPEVMASSTQVSPELPSIPGAQADFDLGDKKIRVDPKILQGKVITSKDKKSGRTEDIVDFTTAQVMDAVGVMLHEFYHGKSVGAGVKDSTRAPVEKAAGLTEDKKAKIAKLSQNPFGASLASISPTKLNMEEFLANADALLSLQGIGGLPDGSRVADQAAILETIMKEIPESAAVIKELRNPPKPSAAPEPLASILKSLGLQ